ncbi:MAG: hypothetical protein RLZZ370_1392 [Bacteroidota bacterium]|jgi:hypothetical protein
MPCQSAAVCKHKQIAFAMTQAVNKRCVCVYQRLSALYSVVSTVPLDLTKWLHWFMCSWKNINR